MFRQWKLRIFFKNVKSTSKLFYYFPKIISNIKDMIKDNDEIRVA